MYLKIHSKFNRKTYTLEQRGQIKYFLFQRLISMNVKIKKIYWDIDLNTFYEFWNRKTHFEQELGEEGAFRMAFYEIGHCV